MRYRSLRLPATKRSTTICPPTGRYYILCSHACYCWVHVRPVILQFSCFTSFQCVCTRRSSCRTVPNWDDPRDNNRSSRRLSLRITLVVVDLALHLPHCLVVLDGLVWALAADQDWFQVVVLVAVSEAVLVAHLALALCSEMQATQVMPHVATARMTETWSNLHQHPHQLQHPHPHQLQQQHQQHRRVVYLVQPVQPAFHHPLVLPTTYSPAKRCSSQYPVRQQVEVVAIERPKWLNRKYLKIKLIMLKTYELWLRIKIEDWAGADK